MERWRSQFPNGSSGGGSSNTNNSGGRSNNHTHNQAPTPAPIIGTEAFAASQLAKNRRDFRYPQSGFCTRVEYSLLYSMLSRPDVYPAAVVKDAIRAEDFTDYLWVVSTTTNNKDQSQQQQEPELSSYAQLSAILSLAADKWAPPPITSSLDGFNSNPSTVNNNNNSDVHNSSTAATTTDLNIPQILCKALIHCVVRHAEAHDLDREHEVSELLVALERVTIQKGRQTALAAILPAYVGLGASILTGGNPIPFYIGYAMSINAVANQERDLANFRDIATTTNRMAHPETASLLTDDSDVMD